MAFAACWKRHTHGSVVRFALLHPCRFLHQYFHADARLPNHGILGNRASALADHGARVHCRRKQWPSLSCGVHGLIVYVCVNTAELELCQFVPVGIKQHIPFVLWFCVLIYKYRLYILCIHAYMCMDRCGYAYMSKDRPAAPGPSISVPRTPCDPPRT